jgi:hypothetical protein
MTIPKLILILLMTYSIYGCATPPKPRECVGEFRPVNVPTKIYNQGETNGQQGR